MTHADRLPHWADTLELREEVVARQGHADHLQMSLFDAVYQVADVPYRDAAYWCEITEPAPKLVGFMATVARRLGTTNDGPALYHLDQGMGGGKSHALVGLYHMAHNPEEFFASDIGQRVANEAKGAANDTVQVADVRTVVLTADHFSPGVPSATFGPAVNLHERFLWSLFDAGRGGEGRRLYDQHVDAGTDKAALKDALRAAGGPVLILLDELMDYAMQLSGRGDQAAMDAEKAFLNSLFDAVDDVPQIVMVVVMIRTEADEQGYEGPTGEFRAYIDARLGERNGTKLAVNEPQDFGAIIRRRIFKGTETQLPIDDLVRAWRDTAGGTWEDQVFSRLPSERQLPRFPQRLERSYPFHPDLLDLVEKDWVQHSGFQRVRSTVQIFSASVYTWAQERQRGRWAPLLIGVGDVPLHTTTDQVLSSGILHGNDRTITALRQVSQTDISNAERTRGRAVELDQAHVDDQPWEAVLPSPAVRMATALWMYSVAVRAHQKRGATKPELLSAVFTPDERFTYADAEETFNRLVDDEEGLGALDVIEGRGGNQPPRYALSTTKTLRMFHRTAKSRVDPRRTGELIWDRTKLLAKGGAAFQVIHIEAPADESTPRRDIFADVDQRNTNRLVVLDPRRWTLLNGRDSATRADIEAMLGVGEESLSPSFAASCVVACVNTQRRDGVQKRAREALAWRDAQREIDEDSDLYDEAGRNYRNALEALDRDLQRAFQHVSLLVRNGHTARVAFHKLEDDADTALSGNAVWRYLGRIQRAARGDLSGAYLHRLLDLSIREYTLQEVLRKFWSDPTFPLVEDVDTARRAIFDALRADEDGVAWEVATADGDRLSPASPEELAITSSDQYLRLHRAADDAPAAENDAPYDHGAPPGNPPRRSPSEGGSSHAPEPGSTSGPSSTPQDAGFAWYDVRIDNAALTDDARREAIWQVISKLEALLDPASGADLQLLSLNLSVNARKGDLEELRQRAADASARWSEREDDF